MKGLKGKTALVTGGARGIGMSITQRLLEEGMRVFALDRDAEEIAHCREALATSAPARLHFIEGDVSDEASVQAAVRSIGEQAGGLQALVNNAGLANPRSRPVHELDLEDWNRVLAVNLTGAFLCTKHCVPMLREQGGAIVNMSSIRALESDPNGEAYAASKGGLNALTHALAVSLGPRVRVNAICPGWIDARNWRKRDRPAKPYPAIYQEDHPVGRIGMPEDIAGMTAFLLSDDAGFITGQHVVVDGGIVVKMTYA